MHDGVQLFMSCFSFEQAWGPTIRGYSRRVVLPLVLSGLEKFTDVPFTVQLGVVSTILPLCKGKID